MTAIIAVANQKGGVGKTITAVTLAAGAARRGQVVLEIDLDPQGNVSDSFGYAKMPNLNAWLGNGMPLPNAMREVRPNLYIVPGDKSTANLKNAIAARGFSEYALCDALDKKDLIDYRIDLVVLDCAPSVDILQVMALMVADYLIIPAKLDQFSIEGVVEILNSLAALQKHGSHCTLAGILPTFYDKTTKESQIQLENLAAAFGDRIWPPIPSDTRVRLANRKGQTLYELEPQPRALTQGYEPTLDRLYGLLR